MVQVCIAAFLSAFTWFRPYRNTSTTQDGQLYNGLLFFTLGAARARCLAPAWPPAVKLHKV